MDNYMLQKLDREDCPNKNLARLCQQRWE